MTWKAALPMYNVSPRLRRGYGALLEALLADAGVTGAVELVDDTGPLLDFWQRPDLLFAQTCGYPWLHALRGHGHGQVGVAGHPVQRVVEGVGGVDRIEDLLRRAPALRRSLLEEPERVAVAAVQVVELRLLERGRVGDLQRPLGQLPPGGDRGDRGGDLRLLEIEIQGAVRCGDQAVFTHRERPDPLEELVRAVEHTRPEQDDDDQDGHGGTREAPRHAPEIYPPGRVARSTVIVPGGSGWA